MFLDGKFNDIPNTVAQATKAAVSLGVELFNVHAFSGIAAIQAAAAEKSKSKMLVVTVLTSLDKDSLFGVRQASQFMRYIERSSATIADALLGDYIPSLVLEMATAAAECGADGVICSPLELQILKLRSATKPLLKVTPGVRPVWADANDQKRVMTPAEAMQQGASYLVIGRPITQAADPVEAAQRILAEITEAHERQEASTVGV